MNAFTRRAMAVQRQRHALDEHQRRDFIGLHAADREGPPWFERPRAIRLAFLSVSAIALGFLLFHGAPAALDGAFAREADGLGPTPYFAALFAIVNVHHYFMDAVIWRRDNPHMRYLHR